MEFSPFGVHKNATVSQTQDAWVKIHAALRNSACAMFVQSCLLASSAWWVHQQMQISEIRKNLAYTVFLSLCTGTILFCLLAILVARTYPQPITFPPHASIRRLQVSRMLMLLFGAGYIVRGIDLLKKSGKEARRAGAYDEPTAYDYSNTNNHNQDYISPDGSSGGVVSDGVNEVTTASIMQSVMGHGAIEACLVCVVGAIGVLSSYWIGKQLRNLRDAMKFTKSFKSS